MLQRTPCGAPEAPRNTGTLAVLLVDMQPAFLQDVDRLSCMRIAETQLRVIRECAVHRTPVVLIEFKHFGQTAGALRKALETVPHCTLLKSHADAFKYTELARQLRQMEVKRVLIMGVYTGGCILDTARGAQKNEFEFVTSWDSIAEHKEATRPGINWLMRNGEFHQQLPSLASLL